MNAQKFNKLIKRAKYSAKAFTELYTYYFPKIAIHIFFKFKNKQLGEDVAQDFFIKLLKMERSETIEYPTAWVYTVSENIAKSLLSKQSQETSITPDIAQNLVKSSFEEELFGEYKDKLEKLDSKTKDIIIKHIYEGYSLKEIAEAAGMNYATTRQKYSRGLKNLKIL